MDGDKAQGVWAAQETALGANLISAPRPRAGPRLPPTNVLLWEG